MTDPEMLPEGYVRGKTYTIITAPEDTIDYKIGYRHGATGRPVLTGQSDDYRDGFAAGFIARREAKS